MAYLETHIPRNLPDYDVQAPKQYQFNPYADNGG
jgi:hypothetical protein